MYFPVWAAIATKQPGLVKKELSILSLLLYRNGKIMIPDCLTAIDFVIDHVNNRSDILPDYKLKIHTENQGMFGVNANAAFFNYLRKETTPPSPLTFMFRSCEKVVQTMKQEHFSIVSPLCHGYEILEKLHIYNNLYSVHGRIDAVFYAYLAIITQIGHWKEIGLLVDYDGSTNTAIGGEQMRNKFEENGISVKYIGIHEEITQSVSDEFKSSNIRIIAFMMLNRLKISSAMCSFYKNNIRPPNFVFLFVDQLFLQYNSKSTLPDDCTPEIYLAQREGALAAANEALTLPNRVTELGYDLNYFDSTMQQLSGGRAVQGSMSTYACHDAALTIVMALNQTDYKLRSQYNMSMLDFKQNRQIVADLANQSVYELNIKALRSPRVSFNNSRHVQEGNSIVQFVDNKLRVIGVILDHDNNTVKFDQINNPIWKTKTGKTPKDLSSIEIRPMFCSDQVTLGLAILVAIVFLIEIILFIRVIKTDKQFVIQRGIIFVGFSLINVSVFCHVLGTVRWPYFECLFRPVLLLLGLSIVHGAYALFSLKFTNERRKHQKSHILPKMYVVNQRISSTRAQSSLHQDTRQKPFATSVVTVVNILQASTMVIWTIHDPLRFTTSTTASRFDYESDTYFSNLINECWSPSALAYSVPLLLISLIELVASLFSTYAISNIYEVSKNRTFRTLKVSVVNSIMFLTGAIFILLVSWANDLSNCLMTIIYMVSAILYTLSNSIILASLI